MSFKILSKSKATWRNGYAEDCKSFYPSSILGVASIEFDCFIMKILYSAKIPRQLSWQSKRLLTALSLVRVQSGEPNYKIWLKNVLVRSLSGLSKKSFGFFASTICPSSMKIMLSATSFANPISCVTTIIVMPP